MELNNHRYFKDVEFRVENGRRNGQEKKRIIGHAAVFDKPADLGPFIERISPGAFSKTIRESDVRALFNHSPNFPLGRTSNNTLKLREDGIGLYMEIEPPETSWARDLMVSIQRGDVTGASIGFRPVKQDWVEGEKLTRILREVELFDVSPVTFPAYKETDVGLRKEAEQVYQEYRNSKNRYRPRSDNWQLELKKKKLQLLELEAGLRNPSSLETKKRRLELAERELL
jgi:HK97 family phage prohead protease